MKKVKKIEKAKRLKDLLLSFVLKINNKNNNKNKSITSKQINFFVENKSENKIQRVNGFSEKKINKTKRNRIDRDIEFNNLVDV